MRLSARAGIGARAVVAMAAAAALAAAALVGAPSANATVRWGSAKAPIHPGVKVTIAGVSCLAGLVMTDGTRVFIAVPTSCTGVNDGQPTDGCTAAQVPVGVKATIQGARYRGTLVYSSYTQMQLRGTTGQNMCAHNDLSLIRLDNRDIGRTNPSVPVVGGPTSVAWTAPAQGAQLTAYIVMPTNAVLMQNTANGWAHTIMAASPIDKTQVGAPVLTSSGRALGMVSLVQQLEGGPATVSDLGREIKFLNTVRGFTTVHLARGTRPFSAA